MPRVEGSCTAHAGNVVGAQHVGGIDNESCSSKCRGSVVLLTAGQTRQPEATLGDVGRGADRGAGKYVVADIRAVESDASHRNRFAVTGILVVKSGAGIEITDPITANQTIVPCPDTRRARCYRAARCQCCGGIDSGIVDLIYAGGRNGDVARCNIGRVGGQGVGQHVITVAVVCQREAVQAHQLVGSGIFIFKLAGSRGSVNADRIAVDNITQRERRRGRERSRCGTVIDLICHGSARHVRRQHTRGNENICCIEKIDGVSAVKVVPCASRQGNGLARNAAGGRNAIAAGVRQCRIPGRRQCQAAHIQPDWLRLRKLGERHIALGIGNDRVVCRSEGIGVAVGLVHVGDRDLHLVRVIARVIRWQCPKHVAIAGFGNCSRSRLYLACRRQVARVIGAKNRHITAQEAAERIAVRVGVVGVDQPTRTGIGKLDGIGARVVGERAGTITGDQHHRITGTGSRNRSAAVENHIPRSRRTAPRAGNSRQARDSGTATQVKPIGIGNLHCAAVGNGDGTGKVIGSIRKCNVAAARIQSRGAANGNRRSLSDLRGGQIHVAAQRNSAQNQCSAIAKRELLCGRANRAGEMGTGIIEVHVVGAANIDRCRTGDSQCAAGGYIAGGGKVQITGKCGCANVNTLRIVQRQISRSAVDETDRVARFVQRYVPSGGSQLKRTRRYGGAVGLRNRA